MPSNFTEAIKLFRLLAILRGQLEEKYFDYLVFKIIDCGFPCLGARRRALAQTIGNARRLNINSPRSAKITLKTCDFVDIGNATIPTTLGGSTTTSPPIVVVILRQQLDYVIVDYVAPTTPHPIKAKFSSSKESIIIYFHRTRHSEAPP
jgi:hypothetical protein